MAQVFVSDKRAWKDDGRKRRKDKVLEPAETNAAARASIGGATGGVSHNFISLVNLIRVFNRLAWHPLLNSECLPSVCFLRHQLEFQWNTFLPRFEFYGEMAETSYVDLAIYMKICTQIFHF